MSWINGCPQNVKDKISETLRGRHIKKDLIPWNKGKEWSQMKELWKDKEFRDKHFKEGQRRHMSETRKRLFKEGVLKPWNFKDGLSRSRFYTLESWIKIAKKIYERDNWTCHDCGKHGGTLNAHHIDKNRNNNSMENLVTLCRSCHIKRHNPKTGG